MVKNGKWILAFAALTMAIPGKAQEDPATGFPPYGSFDAGQFDGVNLENLNVSFAIPVTVSVGRGMNLSHSLVYNSLESTAF